MIPWVYDSMIREPSRAVQVYMMKRQNSVRSFWWEMVICTSWMLCSLALPMWFLNYFFMCVKRWVLKTAIFEYCKMSPSYQVAHRWTFWKYLSNISIFQYFFTLLSITRQLPSLHFWNLVPRWQAFLMLGGTFSKCYIFVLLFILTTIPEDVFLSRRACNMNCARSKDWKNSSVEDFSGSSRNRCQYGTRPF